MFLVNILKENSLKNKNYLFPGLKKYYSKVAQNEIDLSDDFVEMAVKSELKSHDKISQTIIQYITNFIKNAQKVVNGRPWTPDDVLELDSYKDDTLTNFIEKAATEPINIYLRPLQQPQKPKPQTTLQDLTSAEEKPQYIKNISIIIVLSVIGGGVLLTVIIVAVCCKTKKKK
ncbi:hypothetical protein RF11_01415 [Thelohanellus kitauei]|uniref:Uncharacterized protein n=1 Tax=Thelohanellus kitauei TaxID=669202 RepID=A0A0C2N6E3_THEKT|nr:hypothetical protein RF11_01415 [Thelohanellus kitauei]